MICSGFRVHLVLKKLHKYKHIRLINFPKYKTYFRYQYNTQQLLVLCLQCSGFSTYLQCFCYVFLCGLSEAGRSGAQAVQLGAQVFQNTVSGQVCSGVSNGPLGIQNGVQGAQNGPQGVQHTVSGYTN